MLTIFFLLQAAGALPPHSIREHFPELAAWFVPLATVTWAGVSTTEDVEVGKPWKANKESQAVAATARDAILAALLFSLAIGSTIACCLFAYGSGVGTGMKVAAYFWLLAALLAWWRTTVYLIEEAFGPTGKMAKFFPVFRTAQEKRAPLIVPGLGEPGVKRGMPGVI